MSTSQFETTLSNESKQVLSEYGVTESGFRRPGFDTILEVAVSEAEQYFGRDLQSPQQPELQYIEALALWIDTKYQELESLYYAAYYQHASGRQLDNLLSLVGFRRLEERQATGEVTFEATSSSATQEILIPAGTRVKTESDETSPAIYFQTTEPARIGVNESAVTRVPIRGLDPLRTRLDLSEEQTGEQTNVSAGDVSLLHDSVTGVARVYNPLPTGANGDRSDGGTYNFVRGRDRETDSEFKRRYENARALGGKATLDALEAAIRNAGDGTIVQAVTVDENLPITEHTADDGSVYYSGRQVEPIVVLEEDTAANRDAVSQAIYDTRAAGIESVGDISGTAERSDGSTYSKGLSYTLATEVPVYVEATITVNEQFPSDGVEQIQSNLIDTIGGTDENGQRILGSDIGEDISYADVLADVLDRDIPGLIDVPSGIPSESILVGRSANPTTAQNIQIAPDEVARTSIPQITITTQYGEVQ